MNRARRQLTRDEARLWRHVVRDAKPLPGRQLAPVEEEDAPAPPDAKPGRKAAAPPAPPPAKPKPSALASDIEPGRFPNLDKRSAERLAKGQMTVAARLDLHGLTEAEAHAALDRFIEVSHAMGRRCVLVITGKGVEGKGVLKRALPLWLNLPRLRPLILAVTSARQKDGGDGAWYVLLKRQRGEGSP
jgi:DNA-nicking Smr family endonuclease